MPQTVATQSTLPLACNKRQAQSGFIKEALEIADGIKDEHNQEATLEQISWIQTKEGYWDLVSEWVLALDTPRLRAAALMGVAEGMLQWIRVHA